MALDYEHRLDCPASQISSRLPSVVIPSDLRRDSEGLGRHGGQRKRARYTGKNERDYLERLVRRRKVSRGDAQRAEIVLGAAEGLNNRAIADVVDVTRQTVRTWRERFAKHRLDGLDDEPRSGAPRKIGDDRIEQIITGTLETKSAGRDTLEHAQHGEESVKELIAAIEEFINQRNAAPKPLRWTKSADDILASFERFCRRTLDAYAPNG
jgi:transposase